MQLDSISNGFQLVNTDNMYIPSFNSFSYDEQPQSAPNFTFRVYECKHPIELGNIFIEKWTTKHHLLNISTSHMKKELNEPPKIKFLHPVEGFSTTYTLPTYMYSLRKTMNGEMAGDVRRWHSAVRQKKNNFGSILRISYRTSPTILFTNPNLFAT